MEESFSDEISALYYMNLFNHNFEVQDSSNDLTRNLERRLSLLLQEDKRDPLLRDWVKKWIEDLSSIYRQIYETMERWSFHITLA